VPEEPDVPLEPDVPELPEVPDVPEEPVCPTGVIAIPTVERPVVGLIEGPVRLVTPYVTYPALSVTLLTLNDQVDPEYTIKMIEFGLTDG